MTPEETKQAAAVMAAFDPLKQNIQWTRRGKNDWQTVIAPGWDWVNNEYRIAPEPMEVEVWVHDDGRILNRGYMGLMQAKHNGFVPRHATIHPQEVKP